jgi:DNA-binding beta-propeller fold protein YncE
MRNARKIAPLLLSCMLAGLLAAPALAQDAGEVKKSAIVEQLLKQTGVYDRSKTGKTPDFVADPSWPQPLPHSWLLGQIGGLYVDRHDHVWVYQRPRTLTDDEAGLEKALADKTDAKGQPINGLGYVRANGFGADCCRTAPSVLEFDASGKLLHSWGGPSDPGFLGGKCKEEAGCIWPNVEHGIYVDAKDDVWIAGNSAAPKPDAKTIPWTTNKAGGDGFILKFDVNGNFKMRIGGTPAGPDSNNKDGGINGTPMLYQPADMVIDPKTNRLYIADGYGNRRILIVDADSGKYIGHFGAYGNNPVDDAGAAAAGNWPEAFAKGDKKPAFFRNPVHCVKIADDGKIYVCDRGNDRIQIFDGKDAALGTTCSNPNGDEGKCGFVTERAVSAQTYTQPQMPGTAVSVNFSNDKAQSCLYVTDLTNETIYILNRANLQQLGRLGRGGRMAGDFHWVHQASLDSKGNIYTGEVDTAKRVQKFIRYGAEGCTGTGSATLGGEAAERR